MVNKKPPLSDLSTNYSRITLSAIICLELRVFYFKAVVSAKPYYLMLLKFFIVSMSSEVMGKAHIAIKAMMTSIEGSIIARLTNFNPHRSVSYFQRFGNKHFLSPPFLLKNYLHYIT